MAFGKGITIEDHIIRRKLEVDLTQVYDDEAEFLKDQYERPENLPPMIQAIPPGLSREVLSIMEEIAPRIDAIHPFRTLKAEELLLRPEIEEIEGRRIDKILVLHSILSGIAERVADVVWSDLSGKDIEDVMNEEDQFRMSKRMTQEAAGEEVSEYVEISSRDISGWQLLFEQACKELGLTE